MKVTYQRTLILMATILVMVFSLFNSSIVFADDGLPPAEPLATEETSSTPTDQTVSEPIPASEILEQFPENTEIIILNENSDAIPLVTQEAADIVAAGDPLWCPLGVNPMPGVGGCTDPGPANINYDPTSLQSLLNYLQANQPTQNGVIWIEKIYDSGINDAGVTSFFLDGAVNFQIMKNYSLTFQGGWNGDNLGTINHIVLSELNATLNIVNWQNDVTLNDLLISETNGAGMNFGPGGVMSYSSHGAGLSVNTTGNVKLSNVRTTETNAMGVFIYNTFGSGAVTILDGNFSNNSGVYVYSNGAINLKNITVTGNQGDSAFFINDASGVQGNVTLTGINQFTHNNGYGLTISSNGDINLANITANQNVHGAYIFNGFGSGNVTFSGTNTFNNNVGQGVWVYSNGTITVHNVTALGNGMEGGLFMTGQNSAPNNIIFTGVNTFQGNGSSHPEWWYDLYIDLNHNISQYRDVGVAELPGGLPNGVTFISAVQIVDTDDTVVISFPVSDEMQTENLSILYWNETEWVDLKDASFDDERVILNSGNFTDNGYFNASTNFGGIFVLVKK